jgi:hypothetical protein
LTGRNDKCPCGSGLKFKKCHGDPVLKQKCEKVVMLATVHEITPKRLQAGLIDQDTHDQVMSRVKTALIEMVVNEEHQIVESEDRRLEQRDVSEMQTILKLDKCPKCGRPLPAGTKCVKCHKETPGEQARESEAVLQPGPVPSVDCQHVSQESHLHP